MWFMNHILNPVMIWLLRSPLQRWMSSGLLVITVRGRKSGKEYSLPVQYARLEGEIFILPGTPEKKTWWRNLRGGAPVKLVLDGQLRQGQAEVWANGPDARRAASALENYLKRFPAAARMHGVSVGADGSYDSASLQKAAAGLVIVFVKLD